MSKLTSITVAQLAQGGQPNRVEIVDVRTPVEFGEVHASPARNVPLDRLDPQDVMDHRRGDPAEPLYVICKGGNRGAKAQKKFVDAGYENVINIEGGTEAWSNAGLPVVRGKKAISLERQVRIAAGAIVFAGSLAALITGNVYYACIPAFIGGGLVFAGVTDTCGMGMMIAKMPWNQTAKTDSCRVPQ